MRATTGEVLERVHTEPNREPFSRRYRPATPPSAPTLPFPPSLVDGAFLVLPNSGPPAGVHPSRSLTSEEIDFPSTFESLLADFLDFNFVVWEYEPHFFAFELGDDGRPTAGFRPDFYLPASGVYYELTTGSPRVINLKNRRLRRLAELHPGVEVRLWRAADYRGLADHLGIRTPTDTRPANPKPRPTPVVRLTGSGSRLS